jgi:uncharacterized protein
MLKADIDKDLKVAMLSGDKKLVEVLRGLKSAILYKEVADGKRDEGLDEQTIVAVLKKEQKQRRDAIAIYEKAGEKSRADEELYQIEIISNYLPLEMAESDVRAIVSDAIAKLGIEKLEAKDMGRIIAEVKRAAPTADGSLIAQVVKSSIE